MSLLGRNNIQIVEILTSAPCPIVSEQAFPSSAKSAERMDGAMIAGGDMVDYGGSLRSIECLRSPVPLE
jgi:hypothetical protein